MAKKPKPLNFAVATVNPIVFDDSETNYPLSETGPGTGACAFTPRTEGVTGKIIGFSVVAPEEQGAVIEFKTSSSVHLECMTSKTQDFSNTAIVAQGTFCSQDGQFIWSDNPFTPASPGEIRYIRIWVPDSFLGFVSVKAYMADTSHNTCEGAKQLEYGTPYAGENASGGKEDISSKTIFCANAAPSRVKYHYFISNGAPTTVSVSSKCEGVFLGDQVGLKVGVAVGSCGTLVQQQSCQDGVYVINEPLGTRVYVLVSGLNMSTCTYFINVN